jgi:hypothetical protein
MVMAAQRNNMDPRNCGSTRPGDPAMSNCSPDPKKREHVCQHFDPDLAVAKQDKIIREFRVLDS